jgi:hypothetical protein
VSRKRSKAGQQMADLPLTARKSPATELSAAPPAAPAKSLPGPRTAAAPAVSASGLLGANRPWGDQLLRHRLQAAPPR